MYRPSSTDHGSNFTYNYAVLYCRYTGKCTIILLDASMLVTSLVELYMHLFSYTMECFINITVVHVRHEYVCATFNSTTNKNIILIWLSRVDSPSCTGHNNTVVTCS